jgi:hypothetical protein
MTYLRRLVALVATLGLTIFLTAAVTGPTSARASDNLCLGHGAIPASALARASSPGCSLAGRTVRQGSVSVVVPPAGVSVAGEGVSTRGDVVGLRVTNTGHGVTVSTGPVRLARTGAREGAARAAGPAACKDRTFHLEGHKWHTSYRYRLNLGKMPGRLQQATVVGQVKAANRNMRTGVNTCGRAHVGAPASKYLGRTARKPNIASTKTTVGCGSYNTSNVVGFGNLPGNLLGWTCFWWITGGRMNAADMMMDNGQSLVTSLPAGCVNRWDFEGAVTHEMGHVYGLAHTGSGHDNLTMQHILRPCSTYARTLGLGDWLGMKKMYGVG